MCKYCKDVLGPDEEIVLISEDPINVRGVKVAAVELWLSSVHKKQSNASLNMCLAIGDEYICDKNIGIKYCPFCGQDLKHEEE